MTTRLCLLALCLVSLSAQTKTGHLQVTPPAVAAAPAPPEIPNPLNYILGTGDVVTLYSPELEEVSNKALRIDMHGDLNIPLAGHIHAAGLTVDQVESEIETRLKKYVYRPAVLVNVTEYRSQPVSLLGAVATPGVHQLEGNKNLFEVISSAGGLRPDSGNTVTITRDLQWGPIPLPNAHPDTTGRFSVASVSAKSIVTGTNPAENIAVKPHDVISVSKADVIYCIGSVKKPGGFVVGQQETLTALQVISLAEGLDSKAAPNKARIMRQVDGNLTRTEIPVDLKKLLAGKMPDLALKAEDILFVPTSTAKAIATRTGEAAISIGSSIAIYSHPF